MNKSNILIIVRQLTGLVGVAGVSALIGLPAEAQLKSAPNNLHDVTEQWSLTDADLVSPDPVAQTQGLPDEAPAVDSSPASDLENASDLTAPAADMPDEETSVKPTSDIPEGDAPVAPTAEIPEGDAPIAPTTEIPGEDTSIAPATNIPDEDASIAPAADIPAADTMAAEEIPSSATGNAADLIAPTADTLNKGNSAVEEIPASDAGGSAADLMQPKPDEAPEAVEELPASSSVSSTELQQFVNAVTEVQAIERQAQESMAQLITAEGLSPERFNQIFLAQQSANADPAPEITPEEQETFDQVFSQLQAIDQASEASKEEAINAQGLEMERFSQILSAVRQDPDLQQQVQELLPPTE